MLEAIALDLVRQQPQRLSRVCLPICADNWTQHIYLHVTNTWFSADPSMA